MVVVCDGSVSCSVVGTVVAVTLTFGDGCDIVAEIVVSDEKTEDCVVDAEHWYFGTHCPYEKSWPSGHMHTSCAVHLKEFKRPLGSTQVGTSGVVMMSEHDADGS